MAMENYMMDAISVNINVNKNVQIVFLVNVMIVLQDIFYLMKRYVYHIVEMNKLLKMNNVMMIILYLMMDVSLVNIHVTNNVVYVQEDIVSNVLEKDGI